MFSDKNLGLSKDLIAASKEIIKEGGGPSVFTPVSEEKLEEASRYKIVSGLYAGKTVKSIRRTDAGHEVEINGMKIVIPHKNMTVVKEALDDAPRLRKPPPKGGASPEAEAHINAILDGIPVDQKEVARLAKVKASSKMNKPLVNPNAKQDEGPNPVLDTINKNVEDIHQTAAKILSPSKWFKKKSMVREEQLDEISKEKLGDYVKGASLDVANKAVARGKQDPKTTSPKEWNTTGKKIQSRLNGIGKATDKLVKENLFSQAELDHINSIIDESKKKDKVCPKCGKSPCKCKKE